MPLKTKVIVGPLLHYEVICDEPPWAGLRITAFMLDDKNKEICRHGPPATEDELKQAAAMPMPRIPSNRPAKFGDINALFRAVMGRDITEEEKKRDNGLSAVLGKIREDPPQ